MSTGSLSSCTATHSRRNVEFSLMNQPSIATEPPSAFVVVTSAQA